MRPFYCSLLLMGTFFVPTHDLAAQSLVQTVKRTNAGLKGEYFNGPNFEHKVLTRTDSQVNFDWNWQLAGPGVPHEYFSVRWTGKLYAPTTGTYRFSALVDDGVRVWVGGRKVIDEWRKQDDSQFVGSIGLRAGQYYDLRVEYYNDWKGSVIQLYWQPPTDQRTAPAGMLGYRSSPNMPIPTQYLFTNLPKPAPAPKAAPVGRSPKPVTALQSPAVRKPAGTSKAAVASARPPAVVTIDVAGVHPPGRFDNLSAGRTLVLSHVFFNQSSYVLLPQSYPELNQLVQALKKNPGLRLEIAGHTDNVGDPRLNQTLSEFRAKVVATYLSQHGIAENRIDAKGYGGSRPVLDNDSEEHRAQNRRVEVVVK